jgi:hypothetical protein
MCLLDKNNEIFDHKNRQSNKINSPRYKIDSSTPLNDKAAELYLSTNHEVAVVCVCVCVCVCVRV